MERYFKVKIDEIIIKTNDYWVAKDWFLSDEGREEVRKAIRVEEVPVKEINNKEVKTI